MKTYSYAEAGNKFTQMAIDLKSRVDNAKANPKIFKLSTSQFYTFSKQFSSKYNGSGRLTEEMSEAVDNIAKYQIQIGKLIELNFINNWSQSAINNSSSFFPSRVCGCTKKIQEEANKIDPSLATIFDYQTETWGYCHCLDIKSIKTAFQTFIKQKTDPETISSNLAAQKMIDRIKSIDNFLEIYETQSQKTDDLTFSVIPNECRSSIILEKELVYNENDKLGEGVTAIVYKGRLASTGQPAAIKQIKNTTLDGLDFQYFRREISVMSQLDHPCIVKFYGVTSIPPFSIATELMGGGDLYTAIHNYTLDDTELTIAAFDIARAMNYIHQKQIVHRDLKSLNVLLTDKGLAKVCDFGMARKLEGQKPLTSNDDDRKSTKVFHTVIGTYFWMAPELLDPKPYDYKIDVYSYAITLWEMVSHSIPFDCADKARVVALVTVKNERPEMPANVPSNLKELITSCWQTDPDERPSFSKILEHFAKGEIMFAKADSKRVMDYINAALKEERSASNQYSSSETPKTLSELCYALNSTTITPDIEDKYWNIFQSLLPQQLKVGNEKNRSIQNAQFDCLTISKLFGSFISTKYSEHSIIGLSRLQNIDYSVLNKLSVLLPTKNETKDGMIIRILCKNKMFEEALLGATIPLHLITTLESLARNPEVATKTNFNKIVVNCQSYIDNNANLQMTTSAVSCLVGIIQSVIQGNNKSISLNELQKLFQMPFIKSIIQLCKSQMQQKNDLADNKRALAASILYFEAMNVAGSPFINEIFDALFSGNKESHLVEMLMLSALKKNNSTCTNFIKWLDKNKWHVKSGVNSETLKKFVTVMEKNNSLDSNSKKILKSLNLR